MYPRALLGTAVLCPALRMLPPVGTVVGESLASVALLMRTPLQVLANPFAVVEVSTAFAKAAPFGPSDAPPRQVLAARGVGCPDNTLQHGGLRDCGEALFSLDDFYDSAEVSAAPIAS